MLVIDNRLMIDRQTDRQSGLPLKAWLFVFFRGGNTQEATGPRGDRERERDRRSHGQIDRQMNRQTDRYDMHACQRTTTYTKVDG